MSDRFWNIVKILPTDYRDYGGQVDRWDHPEESYPDCSTCPWFVRLKEQDWGVCSKPLVPRSGLLTFEHQAGIGCHGR